MYQTQDRLYGCLSNQLLLDCKDLEIISNPKILKSYKFKNKLKRKSYIEFVVNPVG